MIQRFLTLIFVLCLGSAISAAVAELPWQDRNTSFGLLEDGSALDSQLSEDWKSLESNRHYLPLVAGFSAEDRFDLVRPSLLDGFRDGSAIPAFNRPLFLLFHAFLFYDLH